MSVAGHVLPLEFMLTAARGWTRPDVQAGLRPDAAAIRRADVAALEASVAVLRAFPKMLEALKANMDWIGAPPTTPEAFDSAREDAWQKGLAALALAKEVK